MFISATIERVDGNWRAAVIGQVPLGAAQAFLGKM